MRPAVPAEALARVRALGPDALVVVAYGEKLPKEFLEAAPHGAYNLHFSLLPRLRGAAPCHWAIRNGDAETGVTVIKMTEGIDAGPIVAARAAPIEPSDTAGSLEARLAALGGPLLAEALDAVEEGSADYGRQDETQVTWAPKLEKGDGRIDWSLGPAALDRFVRAMEPWPRAQTQAVLAARPRPVRLLVAHVKAADLQCGEPGGTVVSTDGGLVVAAGGGAVEIESVKPEGKREISGADFVNGYRVVPGDRME
jgi:methionyl-tRNA formyltransferase